MTKLIKDNELSEVKVVSIDRIGCFPGNRWGAGLIAADVHYVLGEGFAKNGFNVQKWECMALTVPELVKKEWTDFNIKIVKQSNGLLPEIVDMDLATGRGSHGTGALRGAKFGCLASKRTKMLADDFGRITSGALLTKQPSLKVPIEEGVPVTVIPGELELACPGMFAALSQVGNVSNSVFRLSTPLQVCVRIHSIAKAYGVDEEPNWEAIGKQASSGLPPSEAVKIDKLCKFVQAWSGGPDGYILSDLEAYEKSLDHRHKLRFDDLGRLSNCELQDLPHIVPVTLVGLPYLC